MNIGIVGQGVVGGAVEHGMRKIGHSVIVHDIKFNTSIEILKNTDICYICVPTPPTENGNCDTSIVKAVLNDLANIGYKGYVAIKSTVSPGSTEEFSGVFTNLSISFVPEFLRERCAIADFVDNHDLCIIGTDNEKSFKAIKKSHGNFPKKFIKTTATEAEFCKYFNNIYNATLITFANSFYEVCKNMNVDYGNVKNTIVFRNHINDVYLECNENFRGFGGVCLPKDTKAFDALSEKLNLDVNFFKTLMDENKKYKTTVLQGMREE